MSQTIPESTDPRVKRTHLLLRQALEGLLQQREFDAISVQDIAEAATLNRATFYAHYPDKYALLECTVAGRLTELLEARGVKFAGDCEYALRAIVIGVCDYVATAPGLKSRQEERMEPHREAAIIAVVTRMMLAGMNQHPPVERINPSMFASTLSWAIFGAVQDWVRRPGGRTSEEMANQVMTLLGPLFRAAYDAVPV